MIGSALVMVMIGVQLEGITGLGGNGKPSCGSGVQVGLIGKAKSIIQLA